MLWFINFLFIDEIVYVSHLDSTSLFATSMGDRFANLKCWFFLETLSLIESPADYSAGDLITKGSRLASRVLISTQTLINIDHTWRNDQSRVFSCIECLKISFQKWCAWLLISATAGCGVFVELLIIFVTQSHLLHLWNQCWFGVFLRKNYLRAVLSMNVLEKHWGDMQGVHWETLSSSTLDCNQGYNLRSAFKTGMVFHGDNDQWVWNGKD